MGTRTRLSPGERLAAKLHRQHQFEREQAKGPGVFIPIRVNNPLNGSHRMHFVVAAERKRIRSATVINCRNKFDVALPAVVTMTRYSPRLLDDDNLAAALKSVRDGVADVFGTNDGAGGGLTFVPRQEKAKGYGVRVVVEPEGKRS